VIMKRKMNWKTDYMYARQIPTSTSMSSRRDIVRKQMQAISKILNTGSLDDPGSFELKFITIPPQRAHTATVIWLHVCA
jgi:hypothetical protein